MKSSGRTDREICEYLGISIKMYMDRLESDEYLRQMIENAEEKYQSEIEEKFKGEMEKKLDNGDTGDAKWFLERTNKKYQKNDKVELQVEGIDEVIRKMNNGK